MTLTLCISATTAAVGVWALTGWDAFRDGDAGGVAERARRDRLRQSSAAYALLGPLLRQFAPLARWAPRTFVACVERDLARISTQSLWAADEWIAAALLTSTALGVGSVAAWAGSWGASPAAAAVGVAATAAALFTAARRLRGKARRRLKIIRAKLPFVIDSMALTIECGASVQESLFMAAGSASAGVVQEELSRVVADIRRGQPMSRSLAALQAKLREPMVDEFVISVSHSAQLGCTVSAQLLAMAERMRRRRSHEFEAAAGRAQIKLYYPGLLLMVVCMGVVVAPFFAPLSAVMKGFTS